MNGIASGGILCIIVQAEKSLDQKAELTFAEKIMQMQQANKLSVTINNRQSGNLVFLHDGLGHRPQVDRRQCMIGFLVINCAAVSVLNPYKRTTARRTSPSVIMPSHVVVLTDDQNRTIIFLIEYPNCISGRIGRNDNRDIFARKHDLCHFYL